MKNYNRSLYRQHISEIPQTEDPFVMETYMRGVVDIANGFNTEEQASGGLDKNDLLQECYVALIEAWNRMDWKAVENADQPQAAIWAYLKKSIKLKARERVHNKKDGVRIPHGKRWEINETKNVDDFLTQLFPVEWFGDNDERMGLYDDDFITRYDIEQLSIGLEDVMLKFLSRKEQAVLEMSYGLDSHKMSSKKIGETLNITVSNVDKTKSIAIKKLKNSEVEGYLKDFYYFE